MTKKGKRTWVVLDSGRYAVTAKGVLRDRPDQQPEVICGPVKFTGSSWKSVGEFACWLDFREHGCENFQS